MRKFKVSICNAEHDVVSAARILASQENCDGEEFDLLMVMAEEIERLRRYLGTCIVVIEANVDSLALGEWTDGEGDGGPLLDLEIARMKHALPQFSGDAP